jgi:predicted RNA-binding Zn-ribbon protein involved in translation (DUF1610 family)
MKDSNLTVTVNLNTGHLIKTIEAFENALHQLKNDLSSIKDNYCENDGEVLKVIQTDERIIHKGCPKCGERYVFRNVMNNV